MHKIINAIERQNDRGKNIHLFASYRADTYALHSFGGYDVNALHPLYSITKALTCAVVLTLAKRHNISLREPLLRRLPLAVDNAVAERLTIDQFANMTTGFDWSEIATYGQADNLFDRFVGASDPLQFLFSRPIDGAAPFCYNSAVSHALSFWATAVSGLPFDQLVEQLFFKPLDIERYSWQRDANGNVFGGHGLALSGKDFVKLMPLFAFGSYRGERLIDEDVLATLRQSRVKPDGYYRAYGYGFWHGDIVAKRFIAAMGNAGQRIYYFPESACSYAFLGDTKPEFGTHEALLRTIL